MSRSAFARCGLLALVTLAEITCGSSSAGNGTPSDLGPAAKAKLNEYCAQRAAYTAECLPTAGPCPESTCLAAVTEQAPLIEFLDCQLAKSCDMFFNDDDCVESAGTSDAERDAFLARCTAKQSACPDTELAYCVIGLPLFRKQWMHALDACLMLACPDVQACVEAIGLRDCFRT